MLCQAHTQNMNVCKRLGKNDQQPTLRVAFFGVKPEPRKEGAVLFLLRQATFCRITERHFATAFFVINYAIRT